MKKILSYLLLCIYATIMIKPVMPTVADAFEHIFNYSNHVATVHQHNGKFHVHCEYIEAAKKNAAGNAPYSNTLKKSDNSNEHILFSCIQDTTSFPIILPNHLNSFNSLLPVIFGPYNFRPPITSVA